MRRDYPEPPDRWGNRRGSPEARRMIRQERLREIKDWRRAMMLAIMLVGLLACSAILTSSMVLIILTVAAGFISTLCGMAGLVAIVTLEDRINDV